MNKKKSDQLILQEGLQLGEQLKQLRLANNYSVNEIFTCTKISPHFIANLENENWKGLPAYAFARGLLINLLEFYRLSTAEQEQVLTKFATIVKTVNEAPIEKKDYIGSYAAVTDKKPIPLINQDNRNKKTENPKVDEVIIRLPGDKKPLNPEEELEQQFSTGLKSAIVTVVLFVLIVVLWYFTSLTLGSGIVSVDSSDTQPSEEGKRFYSLYSGYDTFDLISDDTVKLFFNNQIFSFRLTQVINTFDNQVIANFELNNQKIIKVYFLGESWVDIDEDGNNDVLIKFQKQSGEVAVMFFSLVKNTGAEINFESIWNNQEKILIEKGEKILLKNHNKIPIQIFIKATTLPVHLAYNVDGQRQNTLNLRPGNNINIIANEHVELQIGNFRSIILVVNYMPLKLYVERANQFGITKIVKWLPGVRNETKYDLIIKDFIE